MTHAAQFGFSGSELEDLEPIDAAQSDDLSNSDSLSFEDEASMVEIDWGDDDDDDAEDDEYTATMLPSNPVQAVSEEEVLLPFWIRVEASCLAFAT